ncbi:ribonuclease HI [Trypanosoma cruzi]|nr:ribonuclease HI [Trypanosoma cruzi]
MCSQGVAAQRHRHGSLMEFYGPKPLRVRSRQCSSVVVRPRRAAYPNPRSPHTLGSGREMLRRNRQLHSRLWVDGRSRQPDAGDKSRSRFRLQPFTVENEHAAASTGASGPVVLEPRRAGTSGFRAGASSSHSTRKKHFLVIELHAPRQASQDR